VLVHEDLIEKSPTAVQSLTDSVVAAQLRIDSDRKSAAALLSEGKYLPQPVSAITKALTYPPGQ
jgi:NitT/TauT family transport system substrate-binding protein